MKNLPFWLPNKGNIIWFLLFIFIFILSMDFWEWNNYTPLYFGLPLWLIYLFILTLLTSLSFYLFSKYYWGENSD